MHFSETRKDWDEVLTKDFNECMTAVFESKSYDPAKFCVSTNYDAELLLSEEQKQLNQTQDKYFFSPIIYGDWNFE